MVNPRRPKNVSVRHVIAGEGEFGGPRGLSCTRYLECVHSWNVHDDFEQSVMDGRKVIFDDGLCTLHELNRDRLSVCYALGIFSDVNSTNFLH